MTTLIKGTTFKLSNYTKPTPKNLRMLMEFWKGLIAAITVSTIYNDAPEWLTIAIVILGYVVDYLSKFFAEIEREEAKTIVKVEYPTAIADQVKVTEVTNDIQDT